jgi:hypothetical protein
VTLPNFLIIGAGRSGTTSLWEYLRQHPEVFMSALKEPHFFTFMEGEFPSRGRGLGVLRQNAVTDRARYEALFADAGNAKAVGEASPSYLRAPQVPGRIRALIPAARLVVILRHPVDRTYSDYIGLVRDGLETARTFEESLRDQERRRRDGHTFASLVESGFYHRHLTRYYDHFPREQIRVYLHEDLVQDPVALLQSLFSFLEVDPTFVPDVSRRYGRTGVIQNPLLRFLWTRVGPVARSTPLPLVLPREVRARIIRRITRDIVQPPMNPETRAELLDVFREDITALQDLIGRDLSGWLR